VGLRLDPRLSAACRRSPWRLCLSRLPCWLRDCPQTQATIGWLRLPSGRFASLICSARLRNHKKGQGFDLFCAEQVPRTFFSIPQPYRFSLGILRIQECSLRAGSLCSPAPHSEGPLDLLRVSAASLEPELRSFDLAFTPLPTMRRRGPRAYRSTTCCRLSLWTVSN